MLSAGLALAQGMSSAGSRRSALQNILSAAAAGYGGAGQTYQQGLQNVMQQQQFALPAVNTTGTDTINATLEAAAAVNSPVIVQFSNGGAQFIAGKGMPNDQLQANISGAISGALHIHNVAK